MLLLHLLFPLCTAQAVGEPITVRSAGELSLLARDPAVVADCQHHVDTFNYGLQIIDADDGVATLVRQGPEEPEMRERYAWFRECIEILRKAPRALRPYPNTTFTLGAHVPMLLNSDHKTLWADAEAIPDIAEYDYRQGAAAGAFLTPAADVVVSAFVRTQGTYDAQEEMLLCNLLKPGDRVLEIGSNIGTYTVAMARRVGPKGWVTAMEPFRTIFQIMTANVALNVGLEQRS